MESLKINGHAKQREQSGQMIETALFELLKEKEYTQISVSEIVEKAGVARRTFYRLYDNKEGVIEQYFRRLCGVYKNSYTALHGYDLQQIAKDYFSFWYEQRERLLILHQSGLSHMLYYGINSASTAVIRGRIGDEALRQLPELEYFATYSVGGFINLLLFWIEKGMEENAEQYSRRVGSAIERFVKEHL